MASPILQGTLKDGFGEAVVACDLPEPNNFPTLDICRERFLWAHKEVDFAPHPVAGHVIQITEYFIHSIAGKYGVHSYM